MSQLNEWQLFYYRCLEAACLEAPNTSFGGLLGDDRLVHEGIVRGGSLRDRTSDGVALRAGLSAAPEPRLESAFPAFGFNP